MIYPLREYQLDAVSQSRESLRKNKRIILCMPTGSGKCLAKGTKILMFDGSIKNVEHINKGDLLMGPDSTSRTVLSTCSGYEEMFDIIPTKGEKYTVNRSHILSLKHTETKKIINISVNDYLSKSKYFKHCVKTYRVPVDFTGNKKLNINPYFLGLWIADGDNKGLSFCFHDNDIQVINFIKKEAQKLGCYIREELNSENSKMYHLSDKIKTGRGGSFKNKLFNKYCLFHNKHIPQDYKISSREDRLKILAGILDGDAHYNKNVFCLTQKNEKIIDDVLFIARSLGLAAYKSKVKKSIKSTGFTGDYFNLCISGDLDMIPTLLPRKKANKRLQKKDVLVTGIRVKSIGTGEYFGFEISGDRRFLLSDFTVTHNTVVFSSMAKSAVEKGKRVMVLCDRKELIYQANEKVREYGLTPTIIMPKHKQGVNSCYIASVDTLIRREAPPIDLLIVDEAHKRTFDKVLDNIYPNVKTIGATATPIRAFAHSLHLRYDDLILGPSIQDLINKAHLTDCLTVSVKKDMSNVKTAINPETGEVDYSSSEMFKEFNRPELYEGVIEQYKKFAMGKKALVFNCNVEHSKKMTDEFNRAGVPSFHIDGMTPDWMRKQILKDFAAGKFLVLNNCAVLTTGYDEPSIECIIVNRCTMSLPLWLQMCLDQKTEVLTKDGFKFCDEITEKDLIAQFDCNTEEIIFEKYIEKIKRQTTPDESMIYINSNNLNIRVSNKHDLLFKSRRDRSGTWTKKESEDLYNRKSEYIMPIAGFENKKGCDLTDNELRFIGWFLTDGSLDKNTNRVTIYQSLSQPDYLHKSITDCIEGCGFKYSKSFTKKGKYQDVVSYRISKGIPRGTDKHLTGWGRLEKYINKNLSKELQDLTRKQLSILLETINFGDGHKYTGADYKQNNLSISTGNKLFANNLQMLCITNGFKANISTHNYNKNPLYVINICQNRNSIYLRGKNQKDGNSLKQEFLNKPESIWCVKTKLGTIVTRREGKIVIMGNCGRGSRPYMNPFTKEKKTHFILIDMGGNLYKHNFWEHERVYSLVAEKPKTRTDSVAPVKLCPCCESGLAASATRCKWCEYEFPVAEKPLAIGEFDIIKKLTIPIKKPPINFYAMTDEEIRQYGASKGHKPGWAELKIRHRSKDDNSSFANSSFKY